MKLAEEIAVARKRVEGRAAHMIDGLSGVARDLKMDAQVGRLADIAHALNSDVFELVVAGRFKNGKSSLINALLGRTTARIAALEGAEGPMPVDDLPATATATRLVFAEQPYVTAWFFDGSHEEWSFDRYLREARIFVGAQDNSELFKKIKMFEVGFPAELLKEGVVLVDSPGTSESYERTEVTREVIARADAAILIFPHKGAGLDELKFGEEVTAHAGKVFRLINLWDGRVADERVRAVALGKLVEGVADPTKEDPAKHDIYFVDVLRGLQGTLTNDQSLLAASGLAAFESRLARFLLDDRYVVHIDRVAKNIDNVANTAERQIIERIAVLKAEASEIEKVLGDCQKDLDAIRARSEKIANIIDRAGRQAMRVATVSYRNLIISLEESIPAEFANDPIPSLEGAAAKFKALVASKRYVEDAVGILSRIAKENLRAWAENDASKPGLQRELQPVFEDLRVDLETEMRAIEQSLGDMHLRIRQLDPEITSGGTSVVGVLERVIAGATGLVWMGPGGVVVAAGGWRAAIGGVVGSIGVTIAGMLIASTFGVALAPAAIIALVWAGFAGGGAGAAIAGIEKRVREKSLEQFMPKLRELRADEKIAGELTQRIEEAIAELKHPISAAVDGIIKEEEENLKNLETAYCRSAEEKARSLDHLGKVLPRVGQWRTELKELRALVKQVA